MKRPIIPARDDAGRPYLLTLFIIIPIVTFLAVPLLFRAILLVGLLVIGMIRALRWTLLQDRFEITLRRLTEEDISRFRASIEAF